jgi:hypothetical protein
MSNPVESILRIFISTIGEFTVLYKELSLCPIQEMEILGLSRLILPLVSVLGKGLFLVFEMFVSIMHFNLLIAMMTRTYELIYRTQKEWKRQVRYFIGNYNPNLVGPSYFDVGTISSAQRPTNGSSEILTSDRGKQNTSRIRCQSKGK